jgi:plastocyanin
MRKPIIATTVVALWGVLLSTAPVAGQETLARTPNLSGGWIGPTGMLQVHLPYRFTTVPGGSAIVGVPTFELGLGLPGKTLAGVRFAHGSPTVPGRPNEWEAFGRLHALAQARGAPVDLHAGAAYNGAARSVDGELGLARWLGPARLLAAGRAMTDPYEGDGARFALAAGAVVHPLARRAPIALAGDVATLLDRSGGERIAWSVGVQLGASYTTHTLSVFATNTATSTLQGVSRGDGRVRYGFELTAPIPVGRFLGWYVPREAAMEAVVTDAPPAAGMYRAEARNYLFLPIRIEVAAGTTVEWTNADEMVHTVTATDGSWNSRAIPPGARWRARFDQPGIYPFLCSPHPFMQGVVIVR